MARKSVKRKPRTNVFELSMKPPRGWCYEWALEEPYFLRLAAQNGWRPVPASRFRGIFPTQGRRVTHMGLVLVERPNTIITAATRRKKK